ncbi:N-acetylglutamate synthase [Desulfobotulus alkaliphilus]|uniref:N-acetylglutamate synthase n=1 Tax=Desulfobotulus alkaliphilus TaxID=622671 RepID=A0A562RRB0_9BACT|nr:N-acetyltransferase [Desulfobotulus alkaliphilus]TWI71601.1 N-acetylglutamate synthase [Desulfobotulus alkaliphilus]
MVRHATIKDIQTIYRLLQFFGNRGEMIPRPLSALYDHVRDFVVYISPETGMVAGCCALQFCWEDLAEIRSLAVDVAHQGKGVGKMMVETLVEEARSFGITQLFTLTYQPVFFGKLNFNRIDRADLPLKIWSDCVHCVKFPDCDEIAMMRELSYA